MVADPKADQASGVPGETARRFYLAVLGEGGRIPAKGIRADDSAARDELVRLGLLIENPVDDAYFAVSPRAVADRIGARLRSSATRLLREAEELPTALEGLARAYDSLPRTPVGPPAPMVIEGGERIRHRIAELVSDCKHELLTAQPGPRSPEIMALALRQDLDLARRGASLRVLYQPVVLAEPATVDYAVAISEHGGEIRVLDEPFQRMIVVDRSVAVVPAADDHSRAAFLTDPATLSFLLSGYERDWARAGTVHWSAQRTRPAADPTLDGVGRLLATGLTQRAVATRLGLSERTVAGHIARLRARHGAQTLFQLGWLMRGEGRGGE
ncbi:LuxR C-terminal-related transcriptional regulator [Kitasatospora sp. HPMI-4]|uniref:LuxR C-terminal-related transcriptional regulator n=1 Tax=Kitasatospora sp. HPMI-4 TaxID=3448443 RepID=UPI003F197BC0